MNFTRYRVLTQLSQESPCFFYRRRNELHPLQGIDTEINCSFNTVSYFVEMNFTRYRVLTPTTSFFHYIPSDIVEMNFTRYRVLTRKRITDAVITGILRRNELHPLQGIDTHDF